MSEKVKIWNGAKNNIPSAQKKNNTFLVKNHSMVIHVLLKFAQFNGFIFNIHFRG